MKYTLGVDIGGSHITAAVVDMESRCIIENSFRRSRVNSKSSAKNIINQWSDTIQESIDSVDGKVQHIGVAMPGPFNYHEGISYIKEQDKYDALYNLNVKEMLGIQLALPLTIKFDNDAACFLKGEMFAGSAKLNDNVFGITLGTGLGSAVAVRGVVNDAALWNSPFKESIVEDYLSTRWFTKKYNELTGRYIENVKQLCFADEQQVAKKIFDEFGDNLRLFLFQQIQRYQPEMIAVGGNIAQAFERFSGHLNDLPIVTKQAILGEEAALLGAASCLTEPSSIKEKTSI